MGRVFGRTGNLKNDDWHVLLDRGTLRELNVMGLLVVKLLLWLVLLLLLVRLVLGLHFFDLEAVTLLDFDVCMTVALAVRLTDGGNVLLGVRVDLVAGLGEEELVLRVVRVVVVAIAKAERCRNL